jgi:hypothetical protein
LRNPVVGHCSEDGFVVFDHRLVAVVVYLDCMVVVVVECIGGNIVVAIDLRKRI